MLDRVAGIFTIVTFTVNTSFFRWTSGRKLEARNNSRRSSRWLGVAPVAADLVADAADGSNEGAVVSRVDLAAEVVDVDVHHVRHCRRERTESRLQMCHPLPRFWHL